ncbi:MAG: kelch repeat-containing protein [Pyrinomonadaceae bacterium]
MTVGRVVHTMTKLTNGKILVAGGEDMDISVLSSAEMYDPQTGTWAATSGMSIPRATHTATRLRNGDVLISGGFFINNAQATAELYQP